MVNNDKANELKEFLEANVGTSISLAVFLGYFFTVVQKLVRLAYYKIDIVYLLEIKLEEILIGFFYLVTFFSGVYIINETYKTQKLIEKIKLYFYQILILIVGCLIAYSLTLRPAYDFYIIFILIFMIFNLVLNQIIERKRKTKTQINFFNIPIRKMLEKCCISLFVLIIFIVTAQGCIEHYNKRFSYIIEDVQTYVIVTTFQSDFITIAADINGDAINLHLGEIRLLPISGAKIFAKQFNVKYLNNADKIYNSKWI